MKARARARVEPLALIAAALAIAMAIDYVWLLRQQGNPPLPWVLVLLLAGALLAAYGAVRELPYRRAALLAAAGALTTLGLLALLSIGWPIIAAGLLALASLLRAPQPQAPSWQHRTAAEARIVLSRLGGHSAEASQLFGGLFLPFLRGCSMIASGPGNTRLV